MTQVPLYKAHGQHLQNARFTSKSLLTGFISAAKNDHMMDYIWTFESLDAKETDEKICEREWKGCKFNCDPTETLAVSPDVVKNGQNSSLPRWENRASPFITEQTWRVRFQFNPRHICKASLMLNDGFERATHGCHGDSGVQSPAAQLKRLQCHLWCDVNKHLGKTQLWCLTTFHRCFTGITF